MLPRYQKYSSWSFPKKKPTHSESAFLQMQGPQALQFLLLKMVVRPLRRS